MKHRHSVWHGSDGSYIVYQRLMGGFWWTRTFWLIPNTHKD